MITLLILITIMNFNFTDKDLITIRDQPHKLGLMLGLNKLTEMHSKWIIDVWDKKIPLQAHRGSYKTTSVTQIGAIRELLRFPNTRIGIYRKPYTEAEKTVNTIVSFFETNYIRALFYYAWGIDPRVIKKNGGLVVFNFKSSITNEGSLNAYGIENVKTGTHLDEAICDDIITLDDRISNAKRENTKEGIRELTTNILDEDQECMFVGTPWHKKDGWTLVNKPKKYDVYKTKLLTEKQIESKKKKTTGQLFACNWLLKHIISKEAMFKNPKEAKWIWNVKPVYAQLDAKYSGDHTNGLTFIAKKPDGRYQAVGKTFDEHIDDKLDYVSDLYKRYKVFKLFNEDNADKGYLAKEMRTKKMKVDTYHESMNKHVKIYTYLKKFWHLIDWSPETDPEYMNQILDYVENQEPDDCPDSAASLLREAFYKEVDWRVMFQE